MIEIKPSVVLAEALAVHPFAIRPGLTSVVLEVVPGTVPVVGVTGTLVGLFRVKTFCR